MYYQALTYSPRGQVTQEIRANNVSLTLDRSFDTQTGRLAVQNVNFGSLQSWQLQFDRVGNLKERFDARTAQREILTYDKLDRLTAVTRNGTANLGLIYDDLGNICSKTKELAAAQTYSYGAAAGCSSNFAAGMSPHQVKSAFGKTFSYNDNGDMTNRSIVGSNLSISYDATRLSRVISSTGNTNAKSSFWYSPGGSRYKRIDEKNGSITRTVRYFGAVEKEVTPTKTLIRESIGVFLLINREIIGAAVQRQYRYMFADHLGSVDLITDENANIIERMSFDAHGARRQDNSWAQSILNYQPDTTLRGFTGQEMLDDLGLVHMNARIYDPELGRFLQADSEVEDDATQGLNRYSYCLNNPLSLTDPTGHRSKALGYLKAAIAIAVSIWLPGITAGVLGSFGSVVFSGFVAGTITGGLQGGLEGAFTAGLFYGIGSHFAGLKKLKDGTSALVRAGRAGAEILAHAAAGGTISVLQGGKFGHGFVSAGITEAVSPTITDLHSDYAKVAASAMLGGSVSALAGGKFGNGAATGAFQMAVTLVSERGENAKVDEAGQTVPESELERKQFAQANQREINDSVELIGSSFPELKPFMRLSGLTFDGVSEDADFQWNSNGISISKAIWNGNSLLSQTAIRSGIAHEGIHGMLYEIEGGKMWWKWRDYTNKNAHQWVYRKGYQIGTWFERPDARLRPDISGSNYLGCVNSGRCLGKLGSGQ